MTILKSHSSHSTNVAANELCFKWDRSQIKGKSNKPHLPLSPLRTSVSNSFQQLPLSFAHPYHPHTLDGGKGQFRKSEASHLRISKYWTMCQSSSFCFCWFVLYCSIETGQPQCCQNHGKCCHGQKDLKLILVPSVGALRPPGGTSLHLGYSWGPTSLVGRANTNSLLGMNHAAVNLSWLLSRSVTLL